MEGTTVQAVPETEIGSTTSFPLAAGFFSTVTILFIVVACIRNTNRRENKARRGWRYIHEHSKDHQPSSPF